jgi:uncharacterized protein YegL
MQSVSCRRRPIYLLVNASFDYPGDAAWVSRSLELAFSLVRADVESLENVSIEIMSVGESAEVVFPYNDVECLEVPPFKPSGFVNLEAGLRMLHERDTMRRNERARVGMRDCFPALVMVLGNPPSGDYLSALKELSSLKYASKYAVMTCRMDAGFHSVLSDHGFKVIDACSLPSESTEVLAKLFCVTTNEGRRYLLAEGVLEQKWDIDALLESNDGHDSYLKHLKGVLVERGAEVQSGVGDALKALSIDKQKQPILRTDRLLHSLLLACSVILILGALVASRCSR